MGEDFLARRAAAFQAYCENMPLRKGSLPTREGMQIYRTIPFSRLVQFTVLDTRQFRSGQPCGGGFKPSCDERLNAQATMMGGLAGRVVRADTLVFGSDMECGGQPSDDCTASYARSRCGISTSLRRKPWRPNLWGHPSVPAATASAGRTPAEDLAANPHLVYNNNQRGYFLCDVSPTNLRAELRVFEKISTQGGLASPAATFVVTNGKAGIAQDS